MTRHERRRTLPADGPPRTTPSEAVGESGDVEARREAEKATRDRRGGTDDEGGMTAKRQSPGLGREEQRRPHGRRGEAGTEEE
ncbi:hypothetical protein ACWDUX_28630 [Streptomyces sp. NPDC003444]|uniref:hypothetical protein n=1 Tax=unclassified Streptomyces TaxID=2593676 RepID=UPI000EF81C26|nr:MULTISPECIES: hypothetical protein [unclassified Streptomyces]MZE53509.1 hypothetical protein [Streptomyces sp. SID5770]